MSRLRHAGSPVEQPLKLSRDKEDGIILECVVLARMVGWQRRISSPGKITDEMAAIRAALRLDDPLLEDLIAQGSHRGPWISEVTLCSS